MNTNAAAKILRSVSAAWQGDGNQNRMRKADALVALTKGARHEIKSAPDGKRALIVYEI